MALYNPKNQTARALVLAGTLLAIGSLGDPTPARAAGVFAPGVPEPIPGGSIRQIGAPRSTEPGELVSEEVIHAFKERENFRLPMSILADHTESGQVTRSDQLVSGVLNAGIKVTVHFVHADKGPAAAPGSAPFEGSIHFDQPILGILLTPATLNPADDAIGAPETAFPRTDDRGPELTGDQDWFEISGDRRTLRLSLDGAAGVDQIRIVTLSIDPDSSDTLGGGGFGLTSPGGGVGGPAGRPAGANVPLMSGGGGGGGGGGSVFSDPVSDSSVLPPETPNAIDTPAPIPPKDSGPPPSDRIPNDSSTNPGPDTTPIPAPGAVALLGLGALIASRRSRHA